MRLSGQFLTCLFFYEKVLSVKKTPKRKTKATFFMRTKTCKRVKAVCFAFGCFFYAQDLFVKKMNWFEIVLITSLYCTTEVIVLNIFGNLACDVPPE